MQEHGCPWLKLQMASKAPIVIFRQWSQKSKLTLTTLNPIKPAVAKELSSHHTVFSGRVRVQDDGLWSDEDSGVLRQ